MKKRHTVCFPLILLCFAKKYKKDLQQGRLCDTIFLASTNVFPGQTKVIAVDKKTKYYVVKEKAVPEVLIKVVEAKKILDCSKGCTVQDAIDKVGISRSSFYKYKDDIFPFHDDAKGKTITFIIQMEDEPGLLSLLLKIIAQYHGNILTIHQSVPINGVATLTLSVDILPDTGDAETMVHTIEEQPGVHYIKILGRE